MANHFYFLLGRHISENLVLRFLWLFFRYFILSHILIYSIKKKNRYCRSAFKLNKKGLAISKPRLAGWCGET